MPGMTGCRLGRAAVRGRSSAAGKRAALPGKKDALLVVYNRRTIFRAMGLRLGLLAFRAPSLLPGRSRILGLLPFTRSLGDSAPASFYCAADGLS